MRFAIVLVFALACGDESVDPDAGFDAGFDAGDAYDARIVDESGLVIRAPLRALPGERIPVAIELYDTDGRRLWEHEPMRVGLTPASTEPDLVRGAATTWVDAPSEGDVVIHARVDRWEASTTVQIVDLPERVVMGTLTGDALQWADFVRVRGVVTVPAESTLTIESSALIRLDANARIEVRGDLRAEGSDPITILASDPATPFGMIHHVGGRAWYSNVFVSGGGAGDWTHAEYRHCCIPMVYAEGGTLSIDRSVLFDTPDAKGILTENTDTEIRNSIFAGLGFGTEHFTEPPHTVRIEDCAYREMRGADDDDGMYFWELGDVQVRRVTISGVDDDAIDSESATPLLEDVLLEDAADKCVSVTNEGPTVRNAFFRACRVGVKVDGTEAAPRFERVTMVDLLEEGVRLSDREGSQPDARIIPVFDHVILGPVPTPLLTDYDPFDASFFDSILPAELGTAGSGNVVADPQLEGYEPRADSPADMLGAGFRAW